MKKIFLLASVCQCLLCFACSAQKTVEKTLPLPSGQPLKLKLEFADNIIIKGWDKNEVYFKATVNINKGTLNEAMLYDFSTSKTGASISASLDEKLVAGAKILDCNCDNVFNTGTKGKLCMDISYEIYMPAQANLEIETISGNIEVKNVAGAISAKSISGFVDVSWPEKKGATLALKTITGELYSNLNISFENKQESIPIVGYLLNGTFKGGGAVLKLETISNDVYLRKMLY